MMYFCFCFFSCICLARSIDACNLEIKELNAERLLLSKEPFVEYRKKDHPTIAIEKRSSLVLVNRKFVTSLKPYTQAWNRAYQEWLSFVSSIPESDRRKVRLAEIQLRLKEVEIEKSELVKVRYQKK